MFNNSIYHKPKWKLWIETEPFGALKREYQSIFLLSQKLNENIVQLKEEISNKENRIQELNDTIAQQN